MLLFSVIFVFKADFYAIAAHWDLSAALMFVSPPICSIAKDTRGCNVYYRYSVSPVPCRPMSTQETPIAPVCRYFLQNRCARGSTCFYSHQTEHASPRSENPLNSVCVHYQRGSCRYGSQCTQLHTMAEGQTFQRLVSDTSELYQKDPDTTVPTTPFAFRPCKFFGQGSCVKGETCPFPHIASDTIASPNPFSRPLNAGKNGIHGNSGLKAGVRVTSAVANIPCVFFERGECRKGVGCPFLHDSVKSPVVHVSSPERDEVSLIIPCLNHRLTISTCKDKSVSFSHSTQFMYHEQ